MNTHTATREAPAGSECRRVSISLVALLVIVLTCGFASAVEPKRVLLLGQGPDGHPFKTHEYLAGLAVVKKCLDQVGGLRAEIVPADEPFAAGPELLDRADGAVLFLSEGAKWIQQDAERLAAFERLAARGGGLVGLHWAMGCREAKYVENYVKLFGGCHGGPDRKYAVVTATTEIAAPAHPIMTGVGPVTVEEEFYYRLKFARPEGSVTPLLRVRIEEESHPVAWAWERPDQGRSFGFSGLHFHKNWEQPSYRRMVAQGILWTLKLPVPEAGLDVAIPAEDLRLPDRK
ncbi:MAG: ThuA domain-containing protein [Planctomycetia bacterium]|nr:ThuA domain-containing protein [Planctomycetia bacterium]